MKLIEVQSAPADHIDWQTYQEIGRRNWQCETKFLRFPNTFLKVRETFEQWKKQGKTSLNLLSVPCSIGLEPLTLAAMAQMSGFSLDKINVEAVDISDEAVDLARKGQYWMITQGQEVGLGIPISEPLYTKTAIATEDFKQAFKQVFVLSNQNKNNLNRSAWPVRVKPEVLAHIHYHIGDLRYPLAIPLNQNEQFDLAIITALVGTLLIGDDRDSIRGSIRSWCENIISQNGLLISQESMIGSEPWQAFELVTPTHPLDDLHSLRIFQKL